MKKRQTRRRSRVDAQAGEVQPKEAGLNVLLKALETGMIGNQPLTVELMIKCAAAVAPYFAPKLKPRRA